MTRITAQLEQALSGETIALADSTKGSEITAEDRPTRPEWLGKPDSEKPNLFQEDGR
jgi:hypothetical protein